MPLLTDKVRGKFRYKKDRQVLRGKEVVDIPEESVQTRDKGERILHTLKVPVLNANGEPEYLLGISEDITERKQMETALQESQALYHSLVGQMPAGVFRKDADGRYVFVNPWFCHLKGMTPEKILGKTALELELKDNALAVSGASHHAQIMQNGRQIEVEEHGLDAVGKDQFLYVLKSPTFSSDGKIVGSQGILFDITERKKAEESLRRSEANMSTAQHVAHFGSWELELANLEKINANPLRWSDEMFRIAGYEPGAVEVSNELFFRLVPEEEHAAIREAVAAAIRERGEYSLIHRLIRPNGDVRIVQEVAQIFLDEKTGQPWKMVGTALDITERRQAEEKLQQRESFLSAITENQPGLLWLKDAEGRFLTVNKAFAAACGRSDPEQVRGLTDLDIWTKELAEKYRQDDQQVLSSGRAGMIEEMILVRDKHIWHETFKTPVRDDQGRVIGTTGYARDITERKLAQQKLTEAFNFNQKIISDASVGIVVFKASGRCVLVNETAARTLNATVPQILEQDFRQIVSWRASGMLRFAEEALAAKQPRQCEVNFTSTFGREVSLVCHFSPFDQDDEPHLLLVFNDVTEKKRLEAQFLRSQRMESIGTLAGGIAHDLNNVLAPLLISIQLLKDKIADDEGRKMLTMLESNVNRGSDLVKQVLAFGRGIQGERVLVQIKHIAREMKEIIQETFPKSLRLQMDIASDLWKVTGDATQIQQVLLNLCVNARDAMPDGGKLSIRMENKILDPVYAGTNLDAKPGRYVVINVTDSGSGMTREVQDRIFEPFFTTKEQGKGTGLGLSTSLAIVKSHGGFINCYSEPGKGSTFKVYLPAGAGLKLESSAAEKSQMPRGHDELVLVVDDEEPIRNIAKKILERFGYRVLLAANGADAVAIYKERGHEIAVVITDMAMPVMDGPAAIAALRAINPGVKIIGSSGLDSGVKTGVALRHFLPKPYTAGSVLNTLHDCLQE